jgi:hypothetical protein
MRRRAVAIISETLSFGPMRNLAPLILLFSCTAALADANCSRSELQLAVNAYIEAQTAGDRDLLQA